MQRIYVISKNLKLDLGSFITVSWKAENVNESAAIHWHGNVLYCYCLETDKNGRQISLVYLQQAEVRRKWRNGMLQGIEVIFADRGRMMTSLKKKTYEAFSMEFERKYGDYFSEMQEYAEQAEDQKMAADEIGECISQAMLRSCANKRGKLDARTRSELSLFMVYYVFPAILKLGETGPVIADGVLASCRKGLKNRDLQYVDYDTIYHGFTEKILGLF